MKVLSLFDGISCARVALDRAGIAVDKYYASEIDKYAIQIAMKNYPDIEQLGSVTGIKGEVLHLSGVYDMLREYDSDIQNKLSEQEMLYWLNEDFSISAKIGTQITNADSSESASLQRIEEIWFSRSGVGDIIKTQKLIGSRVVGENGNTQTQELLLQCGEWGYVYRSNARDTQENIGRFNGKKTKTREHRENTTSGTFTMGDTAVKKETIGTDEKRNVENTKSQEISDGTKEQKEWGAETAGNRKEYARGKVQNISFPLQAKNDNEAITEREWLQLSVRKEMETTMVKTNSSIDIFLGKFEIMCGGSPCQDLSIAKKDRKGLSGERSGLFWEYVRLLKEVKPKYFILENVASMPKEAKDTISEALGVQPVMINASLVSAQNRKRLFFCGQIRERLYFNDVLCYTCLQDESKGILGKTQNKGTEKILGKTSARCCDMQNMSEKIQKDRQERYDQDVFSAMSGSQQETKRQEQEQGNKGKVSEAIPKKEQTEDVGIPKEISSIGSGEREDENSRCQTSQKNSKGNEGSLSKGTDGYKENDDKRGSVSDSEYETDMCCVSCHKRLNNRPYRSFVSGWNEQPRKSPSIMSEMQFNEARQNNGRIFDIYQLEITLPEDKGILLKDILEENVEEKYFIKKETFIKITNEWGKNQGMGQAGRIRHIDGKSVTLQAGGGGTGAKTGLYAVALRNRGEGKKPEIGGDKANAMTTVQTDSMVMENMQIRKLTPIECERLQSLPDCYTEGISNTQRYKCLGNAFNVDVVAHILSYLP